MKSLLVIAAVLVSTSAFAVGDPEQPISMDQMKSYISQFKNAIESVGCENLVPISGKISGGSTPMSESQYISIQLASDMNSQASATLVISSLKSTSSKKLSFECNKK